MAGGGTTLEKNLALLAVRSARTAALVRGEAPADIRWLLGTDGGVTGSLGDRQLASLRGPLAEAEKFASSIDLHAAACVVVRGFGLGHHVAALARRLKAHGAVVVFEPDVSLLRAVFERVDCTGWLGLSNIAVLTDPEDTGAIAAAVSGIEAVLAAGTTLVDHPASRARLGEAGERFATSFTAVMKAVRTNVVTTLVQMDVTVRNLLLNLPWYATAPGVGDLAGAGRGRAAVVVSAGPSLRRNIDLLSRPGVRDRVVIIAVQTVLKTLLAKGIRPHFVTALDYHEISRRFYEGLSAADVAGVTLVAEPKCNRAILEAWPGEVRCPSDHVLDQVLGPKLARPMGELHPGATVAHLAYYLARHLGCDPVILIGQDLGFTDGQYYAPGAAIHQVWSSELNEFRNLEMMEWERIVRMRSLLRKVPAQGGGEVYTDEQMATYLVQFERDFMHDAGRGLTTIDATEGGVLKQHTKVMPLHEALERFASRGEVRLPDAPARLGRERLEQVGARLADLAQSTGKIMVLSGGAEGVLKEMLARQNDQGRVDRLITRVNGLGQEAVGEGAYWLVQYINQTGQFNRYRADRAIHIDPGLSAMERQRREIERDIVNVRWLGDAAEHVGGLLREAKAALDPLPAAGRAGEGWAAVPEVKSSLESSSAKVWAAILVDSDVGGLGTRRDLGQSFVLGRNPLQLTLARLARCRGVGGVLLLCAEPAAARRLGGDIPRGLAVEFEQVDGAALREHLRRVGLARLWSRHCWRGGIANMSCFDEALAPSLLAPILERRGLEAAVIVGADWCLVDPSLVDAVVGRYIERPDVNQLTFTQAPPGLGACVVSARIVKELGAAGTPLATVGGLLGYIPLAPQADPIAKPACVMVEPRVRDLLLRCVPDSRARRAGLARALGALGDGVLSASASELAGVMGQAAGAPSFGVEEVVFSAGSLRESDLTQRRRENAGIGRLRELAPEVEDLVVTIQDGEEALGLIEAARAAGVAGVHVRTTGGRARLEALGSAGVDVISVDCTDAALEDPPRSGGVPWIVPRITRSDATRNRIEEFYDRWLLTLGTCVIDPLPSAVPGERIEPLPAPANVLRRREAAIIQVDTPQAHVEAKPTSLRLAS